MISNRFIRHAGELLPLEIDVIDRDPRKNGLGWTDLSDPEGFVWVRNTLRSSARAGDYAQLFWNDDVVGAFYLDPGHLSRASITFQVPVAVIQDSPPDAQAYCQMTTAGGGQVSTSPVREVLVKRKIPGDFDPDHTTPYNDNLAAPIGVPAQIDVAQDLLLTVLPWLNMAVGDVLTLFWGNSQHRVTLPALTAAQVGQPQSVLVPAALQTLAGDAAQLRVDYEVRDLVNNWSGYSIPAFSDVQVDPNAPAAPQVVKANAAHELRLADLAGQDVIVRLPGSLVVETGDTITLNWQGRSADGSPVVPALAPMVVSDPDFLDDFSVPYNVAAAIAMGSAQVSYLVTHGATSRRSKSVTISVIGEVVLLLPPVVTEASGGVLDPSLVGSAGAHVVLAPYTGMASGDELILSWEGTSSSGAVHPYTAEQPVTQDMVGVPVTFIVAPEQVNILAGGSLNVSYQVRIAGGALLASDVLKLTVGDLGVPILPAPSVEGVLDGVLDPAFNNGIASVVIDYQNELDGDVVTLIWSGGVTGNYSDEQTAVTNRPLIFSVPAAQVVPNAGNQITVSYSVSRVPGGNWVSRSSVFSVLANGELPGGDQPLPELALEPPFFPPTGGEPANYLGAINRDQGTHGIWLQIPVTYLNWALNDMIEWVFTGKSGPIGDGEDVAGGATRGTHLVAAADVSLGYYRAFVDPVFLFAVCQGSATVEYSVTNASGTNSSAIYLVGIYIRDWTGCDWPPSEKLSRQSAEPSAVPDLSIAVLDHGGRAGLNLEDLEAPSGSIALSTVIPLTAQPGDYAELYWGDDFAEKVTLNASHLTSRILLLNLPSALIATDSPPDIEVYYISYAGPVQNPVTSRKRPVLVKRSVPGGFDPDNTTPGVNENLIPVAGLPTNIDTPRDLTLTIAPWRNMHEGDVLTLYWGNALNTVKNPPLTLAQVGQPVTLIVPGVMQVDAGSSPNLKVYYEIYDLVRNGSQYSMPAYTDAQVDPNAPAAPRVVEADPTTQVLDLVLLGDALVHVELPRSVVLEVGDLVTLSWQGLPADGAVLAPFVASFTVEDLNILPLFEVPNSFAAEVSGGTARVFYRTAGSQAQHSKSLTVQVVGVAASLAAPSVLEALGGQLNPQDTLLGATVVINPYTAMATGHKVLLTWLGQLPGGTPQTYNAELVLNRSQIGQPVWFLVPAQWVVGFAGGKVTVSYQVDTFTGPLLNSLTLELSVSASSALLPAPTVDQEFGGMLDPYLVPTGTTVRIPSYPGKGQGETLVMYWDGMPGSGSTSDSTAVHSAAQPVSFPITVNYINANLNQRVDVWYQTILAGKIDRSESLVFSVQSAQVPVIIKVTDSKGEISEGGTTEDDSVTLSGTGTPGTIIEIFDGEPFLDTAGVDSLGVWSKVLTALALGPHILTARTQGGLVSTPRTFSVTLPQIRPVITSVRDSNGSEIREGGTTTDTIVTITGNGTPEKAVDIFDGQTLVTTALAQPSGAWTVILAALSLGGHSLTAKTPDGALTSLPWAFTVVLPIPDFEFDTSTVSLSANTYMLAASLPIFPSGASVSRTARGGVPPYTYGSGNSGIAVVDTQGLVTVRANGTTTITASDSVGHSKSFTVVVSNVFTIQKIGDFLWNGAVQYQPPGAHLPDRTELTTVYDQYRGSWPLGGGFWWSSEYYGPDLLGRRYWGKSFDSGLDGQQLEHYPHPGDCQKFCVRA